MIFIIKLREIPFDEPNQVEYVKNSWNTSVEVDVDLCRWAKLDFNLLTAKCLENEGEKWGNFIQNISSSSPQYSVSDEFKTGTEREISFELNANVGELAWSLFSTEIDSTNFAGNYHV